jgi:hypothetical protein
VIFHSYVNVYQRVNPTIIWYTHPTITHLPGWFMKFIASILNK